MKYSGNPNHIIKHYRAAFHIDWECAIAELKALSVKIDEQYLESLRTTLSNQELIDKCQRPIDRWEFDGYPAMKCEIIFA